MQMVAHPLYAWIDARMSRAEFARRVETSHAHLQNVLQFKRGMSLDLACKIEAVTDGEFPAMRLQELQTENLARESAVGG